MVQDCIGVIHGTYVPAWVPIKDHQNYRCRKGFIAQNVMAAVGFDVLFQFVCVGFEGSANDQKVLFDVLQNKGIYNMQVPEGKLHFYFNYIHIYKNNMYMLNLSS